MSDGNMNIQFYANATSLLQAMDKVIKKQQEQTDAIEKTARASKKGMSESEKATAAATREMDRFATATTKLNMTPLEKYKDHVSKLDAALKAGKISQDTFNRSAATAKTTLDMAAKSGESAFGSAMITRIGLIGTAIAGLAPMVKVFTDAITEHMSEVDKAGEKLRGDAPSLAELQQLTNDPRQLQGMIAGAKSIYASGATATLGEAGRLEYTISSASMQKYRDQIAELQASGVVPDMEAMIRGAAALEASMGVGETGGFASLVSKSFGAGVDSPARAEKLLLTASKIAAPAKELKLSDEDVLAAVATVSKELGTAEEAGTSLKSLFSGLAKSDLPKQANLKEYVKYLSSRESEGQNIRDLIGDSQEAITAYSSLRDSSARYDANRKAIIDADAGNVYATKVNLYKASPTLIAAREDRRADARLELSKMDAAEKELMADSLQKDLNAQMHEQGVGPIRRYIKNAAMEGRRGRLGKGASYLMGGSNESFIDSFGPMGGEDVRLGISAFDSSKTSQADEKHMDAASQLNAAAQNMRQVSEMMLQATPDYTNIARQRAAAATPVE